MSFEQYQVFAKVVEEGGFTAAARVLGVSKSFVSKRIRELEDRVGVRLLDRTTRQVTVTDAGASFHERVSKILGEVDAAENELTASQHSPKGLLRVSVPMSFGIRYLSPLLAQFAAEFPEVSLDVDFADRRVDLVAEGFDVAIRIGALADSSLIARKLAPLGGHTVASPSYLERHGTPTSPTDLGDHLCLLYRNQSAGMTHTWTYRDAKQREVPVRVTGRYLSNLGDATRDGALAGLGVAWLPEFLCSEDIAAGRLVPLLESWSMPASSVWAMYPHSRHVPTTVRAFVDFVAEAVPAALHAARVGGA